MPTIIITGSSGFVGSALVSHFTNSGFQVRAFQRTIPAHSKAASPGSLVSYYSFDLADVQDRGFEGADYIVHCAYRPVVNKRARESMVNIDIEGTRKIIAYARKYGIKMIFLSTLSAHPDAESYYGKHKLFTEGLFDTQKDLIIKPGLVLGQGGGLFGRIASILKGFKLVPLVGSGNQRIQTIALDDLCRIIEIGIKKNITGLYMIAHSSPVFMKDLYRDMAHRMGRHPLFIPVPLALTYYLLLLTESIGLRMPFTSQNVLGLRDLKIFDTAPSLEAFGLVAKDCQATLNQLNLAT